MRKKMLLVLFVAMLLVSNIVVAKLSIQFIDVSYWNNGLKVVKDCSNGNEYVITEKGGICKR